MGSQDSFNKKDRESKKKKNKQDKEAKKAERKASSKSGADWESMLAYVDEYGNITSTPPDPTRKKEISAEEIEISVPKRVEEERDAVRRGTVSFFNDSKGYGFIRDLDTQESIFVHASVLTEQLRERDKVTFEVEQGPKGLNAVNVKIVR